MNAEAYRRLRRKVAGMNGHVERARQEAPPPEDLDPATLERLAQAVQAVREGRIAHEVERDLGRQRSQAQAKTHQENQRLRTLKTTGSVSLA